MSELRLTDVPEMKTGMLIRKPPSEVFEAFANPDITTRFWYTRSSGRLEQGANVQWDWEMYGVSARVSVTAVEPNRRIVIEWPGQNGQTIVEWTFEPYGAGGTFVTVVNRGFTGSGDEIVKELADSMGGFSLVLAGAKALLEHRVELNLVLDRYPPGLGGH